MRQSELDFFKKMLETRRAQIVKNILGVEEEMGMLRQEELHDDADYAVMNNNNLVESAIGEQQNKELREIEISLHKIFTQSYGRCEMCEELINIHRLKVKPHAKYCIDCREIAEKKDTK
ncbi:RNA polymerase-binding protein DksA [Sulfurimonas sp. HSL-1716]|uniref:RNA polymerase-binding protein DksA n=1 Tax=Hydrocurvibacter sulfurireducens TaxID=3131937 RepID=UPI0031F989E6